MFCFRAFAILHYSVIILLTNNPSNASHLWLENYFNNATIEKPDSVSNFVIICQLCLRFRRLLAEKKTVPMIFYASFGKSEWNKSFSGNRESPYE